MIDFVQLWQHRVEAMLLQQLPPITQPPLRLHEAMHYSVFNQKAKRLRPLLIYAVGTALGAQLDVLDLPACAVELIHTYSLVHDDLPAIDNDDYRRGKPACHKAFDEATAILVGDALQALAFSCLTQDKFALYSAQQLLQMLDTLVQAVGSEGMVGGQALELSLIDQPCTITILENIYQLKTGALIRASIQLGAIAAGISALSNVYMALKKYADCLSLAFQIQDDILDIEGTLPTLGKEPGSDHRQRKATYPVIVGLEQAKHTVTQLKEEALRILNTLSLVNPDLKALTIHGFNRTNFYPFI